jgi:hypothetical protein
MVVRMTYLSTRDGLLRAATARLVDNRPFTNADDDGKPSEPTELAVSRRSVVSNNKSVDIFQGRYSRATSLQHRPPGKIAI